MPQQLEVQPDYDADPKSPWRDARPVSVSTRLMYIIGFIGAVFVLDRLVGFAAGQLSAHSYYRFSMLYAGRIDADVAIVGDSRGAHSLFAPSMSERLGVPVFNLSMNGMGLDVQSIVVADYLDNDRPPKIILLEITSAEVRPGESLLTFQPFFKESARLREALRKFAPDRYWACMFFHAYRYNGSEVLKLLMHLRSDDQHWISPAARKIPPELLANRALREGLLVTSEQVVALKRIMADARAKGVLIVPFIAPYLPGAIGDRNLKLEYQVALGFGPDDPAILDYSRAVDSDDAFADRVHPNELGAHILLERMIADGIFRVASKERN